MNYFSGKPKTKATELNNENKGVKFLNRAKNNFNGINKNTTNTQFSSFGQKNTLIRNTNFKLRTNNNTFKPPPRGIIKSSQNALHKNAQIDSNKQSHNELRNGSKNVSLANTRSIENNSNNNTTKPYLNRPIIHTNIKKYVSDDNNVMKNTNKNNIKNNRNSRFYNSENNEMNNNKDDNINNSESILYTYTSPIKRKYEAVNNTNQNTENDNNKMNTLNKKYAQRNYYFDNNLPTYYNNKVNNENSNSNNINENANNYNNFYSNEKLFNNNNTLDVSYITFKTGSNIDAANEVNINNNANNSIKSHSLARNYDKQKNGDNILNNSNCEPNYKYYYLEQNGQHNLDIHINKNLYTNDNPKNGNCNNLPYHLNSNILRSKEIRESKYLADTHSEKMMNSTNNNDVFNTCTIDRLSEENFNSYVKRKSHNKNTFSGINNLDDITRNHMTDNNNNNNRNESNNSKNFHNLNMDNEDNQLKNITNNQDTSLKNSIIGSNIVDFKNISMVIPISEGNLLSHKSENGSVKNRRSSSHNNMNANSVHTFQDDASYFNKYRDMNNMQQYIKKNDNRNKKIMNRYNIDTYINNDNDYLYFRNIINNITKYNSGESDIDDLCKTVMNINDYSLNFDGENEGINEIIDITNNVNNNIINIQQAIYNKKKIVQDKRNVINEEYEIISQKLKDCESIFCDTNDETGEKKLKVFYEIDEKKNILKNKYQVKKMLLKKAQYKIDKLQEYTDAIKLKTMAISKKYKRTYLLIEELFRLKIIKDNENELEICLIPKNTETNMWHRLQLDKKEITPEACDYLWSQIESFVDKETFDNYF
ncbi:conserved Plasmodium protein, unknown function [Plasmodium berghei]|uniref:Uncharacterized protein n=2 Tax=Plasmodium berghei TaxID=5821 RepID=A0A509B0W6_PLABA|nr:conserved Plasmodium protein, unknown function [Plasmodium berghei ANKA]CXJ23309.1 conserved Plasmodium protein, unknown function [Plasmodium berghei]SCM26721.1 conserved Plasmodium protein, unknown function [Plasmodium berghei]SCN28603.1 conserved Plasmodium protein, unknown function [Plasmodium berghei]SCO62793.1 conserved Plasmodium protein, unknown function [Plasmodium berghei]SCO64351.1 conserved Plasmodium protein, unknown function [Plasmodium berghei]|eukprot:XP_034424247.1 conserved Plasmodium protein, unknown function [Plasmodium berghei ANKA]